MCISTFLLDIILNVVQTCSRDHDVERVSISAIYPYVLIVTANSAQENVIMPLSNPIKGNDGTMMSEIAVPKGTVVAVGILASNCNEELWGPDALEWKPERWLKPLPEAVIDAHIPGIYSNL